MNSPLIAWVGDDFTGAAASMEVLTFAGLSSILFLGIPTTAQIEALDGIQSFGIATLARSKSPEWMTEHLPEIFNFLAASGAALVHYKICSTLDSSPTIGSIGKAADLAMGCFGKATIPVVTAAPPMGRYQVFGHLFCEVDGEIYRLDRHPTMSRHPITPMNESDVALHISKQTELPTRCIDLKALTDFDIARACLDNASEAELCTIDMLNADHQAIVGRLLWERRKESRFVIGSQGVEYALVAHLRECGHLAAAKPPKGLPAHSEIAVVSGSVSATTAAQIDWAKDNGFALIRVDPSKLCNENTASVTEQLAVSSAKQEISNGQSPLIYTARGPDDSAVKMMQQSVDSLEDVNVAIGRGLGRILRRLLEETDLKRVAVSGGDTSGHVCTELGIFALKAVSPTIPGAAICRAISENIFDGLEIALKGGQMGTRDYFGWVRAGGGIRT